MRLNAQLVVTHEFRFAFRQHGPVAEVLFVSLAAHRFLVLKRFVVFVFVGCESVFAKNEFRQIKREAVCIFEGEHIHATNLGLTCLAGLIHQFVEQRDSFIQRTEECLLFALDNRHYLCLLLLQFRISVSQVFYQLRNKLI